MMESEKKRLLDALEEAKKNPSVKWEVKKFIEDGKSVVRKEHEQMPKICEKCNGTMIFIHQVLIGGPTMGDSITYQCTSCEHQVSKFFPFSEEYMQHWNQSSKESANDG